MDLRLDLEDGVRETAIVPGKPSESELLQRVLSDDADQVMPPADSTLSLTDKQKAVLKQWIEEGAIWEKHWAFVPPQAVDPPNVQLTDWPRNAIDHFVLRQLEERSITPSTDAAKATLFRRVSFDLTGLPPTLEELDAFLADDSPDAWERTIDRLLQSPHYGERMASDWLDVARYSDTFGYQVDRDRHVWPWRDWVIRSFNDNMPYDQFVTRQLAGDLLPNPTHDDMLATTFNRLHPQKVEGGSIPEEFRIEYVADRTQTFATAFLGLTMECCRCHDHKYDPVSQREYYRLSAFFDNIDESGLYSFWTQSTPSPTMLLPDDSTKTQLDALKTKIAAAEEGLSHVVRLQASAFESWLSGERAALADDKSAMLPDLRLHLDFGEVPTGDNRHVDGVTGKAVRFSGDDAVTTKLDSFTRDKPFTVALWLNVPDVRDRAVIWHYSLGYTDAASRGCQLVIEGGHLNAALIHYWPGNAISIRTADRLSVDTWTHVAVRYDGSSRAAGLTILVDGQSVATEVVRDNLFKEITADKHHLEIGQRNRDRGFTGGQVDELDVFDRAVSDIEIGQLVDQSRLQAALKTPVDALTDEQTSQLLDYYMSAVSPTHRDARSALQTARESHSKLINGVQEIMIMRETETPRKTYLLNRGAYDARADVVQPDTPSTLSAFPADVPKNRLGLAQWLTADDHPLAARVAVNHYWQMMFGWGLVRSPEDFGSQGRPATHPQLLDWLAVNFMQHDWDVRHLLKQMAMSATYRQTSETSAALAVADPRNELLARFSSYRLPAEMLRDNALSVSGLLIDRQGGPPAKPYEVAVSFKPVKRDKGDGLYRRSVYTYWKRTGPAPVMMVLDAAKRDVCRVARERTASPLEAFVLMNGPQYVEASRALAERLLTKHSTPDASLVDLFRTLTSRIPTKNERAVMQSLLKEQQAYFADDRERAANYLEVGERAVSESLDSVALASLTAVTNALFNYDECLTKR